jgi:uncharacterized protein YwgA
MNPAQRQAVLLALIRALKAERSWCGETHIQKTVYFLQTALGVDLGFPYILYKYGPFSFDLNDELTALRANLLLDVKPEEPYGSHLYPSAHAERYLARFPRTLGTHLPALERVAALLGAKSVTDLERVTTMLYATRERQNATDDELIERVREIKPHITHDEARDALRFVRELDAPEVHAS